MKIPQNKWQSPFREETLLPVDGFRRFCDRNGIHLSQKDFLFLWQKKLLIPVARFYLNGFPIRRLYMEKNGKTGWYYVYPEDVEKFQYEKLDPQIYYEHGTVYFIKKKGGPYRKNFKKGKHSFPSHEKDSELEYKFENITHGYLTDPKPFEENYIVYFDKTQILTLKLILQHCGYFYFRLNSQRLENKELIKNIQKEILEQNRFLHLFQDWRDILEELNQLMQEKFKETRQLYPDNKREQRSENKGFYDRQVENLKPRLESILQKHNLTLAEVQNWGKKLTRYTFFNEYSFQFPFLKNYLKEINSRTLRVNEYVNMIIDDLNWSFEVITGKDAPISEFLQHMDGYRSCEICKVIFKPRNKYQITCGKENCINAHKKKLKQKNNYYRTKKKN